MRDSGRVEGGKGTHATGPSAWDEALRIAAHDLRGPLAAIAMASELLVDRGVPEERKARLLDAIRESVQHAEGIVANYLEQTRADAAQQLDLRPSDARGLVHEVVEALRPQAQAKGVALECRLPRTVPPVLIDGERVRQVCWNLIGNAIKFTPPGGHVVVAGHTRADALRISIADTGPGIAPGDLTHIFERYWHASPRAGGGTGLGLAIAREIVERHGGRIGVESQPGRGTCMHFTLALAPHGIAPARRHGSTVGLARHEAAAALPDRRGATRDTAVRGSAA